MSLHANAVALKQFCCFILMPCNAHHIPTCVPTDLTLALRVEVRRRQEVASLQQSLKAAAVSSKGGDKAKQLAVKELEKAQKKLADAEAKFRSAFTEKGQVRRAEPAGVQSCALHVVYIARHASGCWCACWRAAPPSKQSTWHCLKALLGKAARPTRTAMACFTLFILCYLTGFVWCSWWPRRRHWSGRCGSCRRRRTRRRRTATARPAPSRRKPPRPSRYAAAGSATL